MFTIDDDILEILKTHKHLGLAYTAVEHKHLIAFWCRIEVFGSDRLTVHVINGNWSLDIDRKTNLTMAPYEGGGKVVWAGEAPFHERDYSEAMTWIEKQIEGGFNRNAK